MAAISQVKLLLLLTAKRGVQDHSLARRYATRVPSQSGNRHNLATVTYLKVK